MLFWQGFLILSLVSAVFILWPTLVVRARKRKQEMSMQARSDVNAVVFTDHVKELEATHGRGEIDADELESLRQDLEKTRVYDDDGAWDNDKPVVANWRSRVPVFSLALAIPLLALLIYFQIGAKWDWHIVELRSQFAQSSREEGEEIGKQLLVALQKRLDSKPKNSYNWSLLGETASRLGQHEEAVRAYRQLLALHPNSPEVVAELAQALFRYAGTITPEVRVYISQALAAQPDMPSILGLAGIDAFQSGHYSDAISHWQKAIAKMNPHSADSQQLSRAIKQAQTVLADSKGGSGEKKAEKSETTAQSAKSIEVRVSLDKAVQANPTDTVFVYARAWQGPPIPLAIQKITVADLPRTVLLDESMAMDPNMSLATASQVELIARISKSGGAVPKPGDWQANAGPVVPGESSKKIKLLINKQIE